MPSTATTNEDIRNCLVFFLKIAKVAQRMKELRQKQNLTQEEAARMCKMEYKYYQRYEGSKDPRDMRLSTVQKIADGFGVHPSVLLREKN